MTSTLTFPKGSVHPPELKKLTEKLAVEVMPLPMELEIILGQHIGAPCNPVVARRVEVAEGDLIGEVTRGLGVPLHSPVAGTIKALAVSAHPIRVSSPSITLKVNQEAAPKDWPVSDWQHLGSGELLKKVHDAGIIGIGGAGFPTHVKLKPPADNPIDT